MSGGMPIFFMFAIAFTAIILDGRTLWFMVSAEVLVFGACLAISYQFPQTVTPFAQPLSQSIDIAFAMTASGLAMVVSVRMLVGIYERNRHQLQQRNAELARIDQSRGEFLAMVAHELNTPLTVIQAHAEESRTSLAVTATVTEQDLANLKVVEGEASRLGRLVSQLLDLGRINSGTLELSCEPHNLDVIVQQTLQIYRPVWSQYGNTVTAGRRSAAPMVNVDRERIMEVLVNLLSNAARHTRQGTIAVEITESNGFAVLSVSDDGEGIEPEVLSQLGRQPMRGRSTGVRSARDAGLGVGLVIASSIMQAHGGSLEFASEVGKGTTATCRLPLVPQ